MPKVEMWQLKQRQSLPIELKIRMSERRIQNWYEHWHGNVYVSFSGGKDSTVLLDMIRKMYPKIPAVFVNTGLEYPEILQFVKTIDNVIWLRPKMNFKEVLEKYGYPVISKEQAQYIDQYKRAKSKKTKDTRWNGNRWGRGKISEKWKYLVSAKFNISDRCCNIMKKNPINKYEKATGFHPFIGTLAYESSHRTVLYLKAGCNSFKAKRPKSIPLGFWLEKDIWDYLKLYNVPYSRIYNMGYKRTGCVFCMFGVHLEKGLNRFQRMKKTHPKLWNYCINKLNCKQVLDAIKVDYK